jgi:hypothetical protein
LFFLGLLLLLFLFLPTPLAQWFKTRVCGLSRAGIPVSIPLWGHGCLSLF